MVPLIVLITVTSIARVAGRLGVTAVNSWPAATRAGLCARTNDGNVIDECHLIPRGGLDPPRWDLLLLWKLPVLQFAGHAEL